MSVAAPVPDSGTEHLEELVDVLVKEVHRLIDGVAAVGSKVDGLKEQLKKHTDTEEERSNRLEARMGQLERLSSTWAGPTGAGI